jgi:hypothetical protein
MFESSYRKILNKQCNENIRKRLGIEPVLQFVKRQQIKLFCHLQRMPINALPYRAYNELADGFKGIGRPRKRWRDDIIDTLQQHGLTIKHATRQASARIIKIHLHCRSRK